MFPPILLLTSSEDGGENPVEDIAAKQGVLARTVESVRLIT